MCNTVSNQQFKVSIVMPVYNAEKYIAESLNSLINQTYKHIQVICVDDGSSDNTINILKSFSIKDTRIQVLNTEHRGAANARNFGMQYAKGEYICFLDCDDKFESDMIEKMYDCADRNKADIVFCEYDTNFEKKKSNYLEYVLKKYMDKYSEKIFQLKELPIDAMMYWITAPWNKMFRKDFLTKNSLLFQDLKSANDLYFSTMAFMLAEKIVHISDFKAMVHYRTNIQTQISGNRTVKDVYAALKKVYDEMIERNLIETIYAQYFIHAFFHIMTGFLRTKWKENECEEFYEYFVKRGMAELGLLQGNDMEVLKSYKDFVRLFRDNTCESQWYKEEKITVMQLENKGINELQELCASNRVAVWGAGARGMAVINTLEHYSVRLNGIIDSNPDKQGKQIGEYMIQSYDLLYKNTDVVIVTGKAVFDEICSKIWSKEDTSVKVLPMFMYLESDYRLQDCIFAKEDFV